ncbi:hypothetical protein TRVL_06964 [Trypanosoma vivax]|nr:hypothetical protein TRVL_06964 [Trypanosoma vivax]
MGRDELEHKFSLPLKCVSVSLSSSGAAQGAVTTIPLNRPRCLCAPYRKQWTLFTGPNCTALQCYSPYLNTSNNLKELDNCSPTYAMSKCVTRNPLTNANNRLSAHGADYERPNAPLKLRTDYTVQLENTWLRARSNRGAAVKTTTRAFLVTPRESSKPLAKPGGGATKGTLNTSH